MDWQPLQAPPKYPDVGIGKGLATLWETGALKDSFDFTIKVGHDEFKVHRWVIAATSHYFKALLESDMTERNTSEVELKRLNSLAVSNIIEYIYTNKISGEQASPEYLLECAAYLQIPSAIEMASKFLIDEIDEKNCFDILHIVDSYSIKDRIEYAKDFILSNFDDILMLHDLERMSYEHFYQVVELWGNAELDLFEAIQKWISINPEGRNQHKNDLMCQVRFGLMTTTELEAVISSNTSSKLGENVKRLIDNAMNYCKLPMHKRVLDHSEQTRVRSIPVPVVMTAHSSPRSWALHNDGSWKSFKTDNDEEFLKSCRGPDFSGVQVAAYNVVNNFLIVCGTISHGQEWHIFDPRTMSWSTIAKMKTPRCEFALVDDGRSLYALGGRTKETDLGFYLTDTMEKYNFKTNKWRVMKSTLPVPMLRLRACQLCGSIYIISGVPRGFAQSRHELDCFHPRTKTWESKALMPEKRFCLWMNVIKLRGEEFIHVMCDNFIMMYYNPRNDQWSIWTSYSDVRSFMSTSNPREYGDGAVLARNDTLFLLNFDCSEVEYRSENGNVYERDEPAHCYTWKLHTTSRYIETRRLCEFPLYYGDEEHIEEKYISGLLSFLPQAE